LEFWVKCVFFEGMNELTAHYRLLLGLDSHWEVRQVDLSLEGQRVEIVLEFVGQEILCPECGVKCGRHDLAPERTWRHLDTMQFETVLRARIPRCDCVQCGVKNISVPWAEKHSRFTLMFEAFALRVLQACSNVQRAASLLGLKWETVHSILERGVARGLERRQVVQVQHVGLDEKSFQHGQSYVSIMVDLDGARVLEVTAGRTAEAADKLWESLPKSQCEQIQAVAMDMSDIYETATRRHAPQAEIVHDKFHVAKYLNEAVDKVRRAEHKELQQRQDHRLKRTRQLWLFAEHNLSEEHVERFGDLRDSDLKTARAWALKENFRWFWTNQYAGNAKKYFAEWYTWASRCRLRPMIDVAKMLKRRLPNLLTYMRHPITNAMSEGFNSKIQNIKSDARGFRSFENYRTRILFYCGKLDVMPPLCCH
jgi:transposase